MLDMLAFTIVERLFLHFFPGQAFQRLGLQEESLYLPAHCNAILNVVHFLLLRASSLLLVK
jgi:hypothetical protein